MLGETALRPKLSRRKSPLSETTPWSLEVAVRWVAMIKLVSLSPDERMRVLHEFTGHRDCELVCDDRPFWFFFEGGSFICTSLEGRHLPADLRPLVTAFRTLTERLALPELPIELGYVHEPMPWESNEEEA